jgi:dolichyl-phosphate beta-glucosyltransferase
MTDLSIIIPVYNEQRRLPSCLITLIPFALNARIKVELLIVDNGSTDDTRSIAEEYQRRYPGMVRVFHLPMPGKGAAVSLGMLEAVGDWRYMIDVDLAVSLDQLTEFWRRRHLAALVIGSREFVGSKRIGESWLRHALGRVYNLLAQELLLSGCPDTQCGFKLFSARAAQDIFSRTTIDGLAFDVEVLYIASRFGYLCEQVPVIWRANTDSRVHPLRDSYRMFRDLLRIRRNGLAGVYNGPARRMVQDKSAAAVPGD